MLADVTSIDLASRSVDASCHGLGVRKISFDYLIIAAGMQPSCFGQEEFAKYAPGLKTVSDAETIRAKILSAYELANETDDENERARQMTFVLVGAGATGVELAASIAHLAAVTLRGQFRRIDPKKSSIVLVEGGKRILPTFAESLSMKAARRLEKLGVKIMTGIKVDKVDAEGVVANGTRIPSATVLWTAGVAPSPLLKLLAAPTDRAGRISVGPFMNVPDIPGVFVVGDASSVVRDGRPVPGVAQAAIQEGRYVGRLIARQLKGHPPKSPFRYFDKGNMAVVGKNFAVLESGHLRMSGFVTWLIWATLHVMSLPQPQNKWRVRIQWFWSYFTGQQGSRLIPEQYGEL
jgi:NADH:ubiquinone reductase (H+-translocating)